MNASVEERRDEDRFVVFAVGDQRLAVELEQVVRVTHAVAVEPIPGAPDVVAGAVVLRGEAIAAIDMRSRLGLPRRDLELTDRFVLVQRGGVRRFLIADAVVGAVELPRGPMRRRTAGDCLVFDVELEQGVVSVIDLGRLLTIAESQTVARLLAARVTP